MTTDKRGEKDTDNEEVIGQNNPRQDMREAIYKQADERRASDPDFTDVADDDHDKLSEVSEEEQAPEKKAEEETAAPAKRKYKLKVNGQEVERELTEEEIAERLQKAEAADQRFEEAARLRKEAEELKRQAPVDTAPAAAEEAEKAYYVALARAQQMGSEEEAVASLKQFKDKIIEEVRRTVNPEAVLGAVDQRMNARLSFEKQQQKFLDDYKDVMGDAYWRDQVLDREEWLAMKGEAPGYERMKKAGEWARELKAKTTPQDASREQKLERKSVHSSQRVQAANVRQAPPEDEDREESTSETIAGMAKARGQRVVMGNV